MAMPEACGATVQPSFLNPCTCMCDVCATDAECDKGTGGRCVTLPGATLGGYDHRACVYADSPCHPDAKRGCPRGQHCVDLRGLAQCEPTRL
jgi:hypothetical protein